MMWKPNWIVVTCVVGLILLFLWTLHTQSCILREEEQSGVLEFDLPDSKWENSVVLHPDGTYRVWESKDGKTWGYGAVVESKD